MGQMKEMFMLLREAEEAQENYEVQQYFECEAE